MQRSVYIPWDLEGTPLQIKTNSTLGSNEHIWVLMFDKDSSFIGGVGVKFTSPNLQYFIGQCSSWANVPVQPPVEVDKILTITKTETAFIITCNDVEVLNYLLADSSESNCDTKWGGDVVQQIQFSSWDRASDLYRAGRRKKSCYCHNG